MVFDPSALPTGTVKGRYSFVSVDNNDADTKPQMTAVTGDVVFTCSASPLPIKYDTGTEIIGVIPKTRTATFDADGYLGGPAGIELEATDSAAFNPTGFTWTAVFNLRDDQNKPLNLQPVSFSLGTGEIKNLVAATPVGKANGALITQGNRGRSAYELAVLEGFTGTQSEWLASLVGNPGTPGTAITVEEVTTPTSPVRAALDSTYTTRESAAAAAGNALLSRFNYRNANPTPTWAAGGSWRIRGMSQDGKTIWAANGAALGTSTNDGASFTTVYTFTGTIQAIAQVGTEMLVTLGPSGGRAEIWKSTGWGANPATATWVRTFQAAWNVTSVYFAAEYGGLAVDGTTVWACEYGKKTNSPYSGFGAETTAVRIWKSTDSGATWAETFRLDNWLTSRGKNPASFGHHLHGICWDPYWGRLWATYGDSAGGTGENGVIYSDDRGTTWNIAYLGSQMEGGNWQVVMPAPMPDSLVLLPDGDPGAVIRIPRKGYRVMGAPEIARQITALTGTAIIGVGAYKAPYPGAPLLICVQPQLAAAGPIARIIATADGTNFVDLIKDTAMTNVLPFKGLQLAVGPTATGKIVATSVDDGRFAGTTTLTIDATTL